jgi:hypothetical protein
LRIISIKHLCRESGISLHDSDFFQASDEKIPDFFRLTNDPIAQNPSEFTQFSSDSTSDGLLASYNGVDG